VQRLALPDVTALPREIARPTANDIREHEMRETMRTEAIRKAARR
jgi:hypothetical protein